MNSVLSGVPAMVYRLFTDGRVETVLVSRGKQYVQSSCFTYTNLKSFVADVNLFLLQMLPDSDDTVLNGTDPNCTHWIKTYRDHKPAEGGHVVAAAPAAASGGRRGGRAARTGGAAASE